VKIPTWVPTLVPWSKNPKIYLKLFLNITNVGTIFYIKKKEKKEELGELAIIHKRIQPNMAT